MQVFKVAIKAKGNGRIHGINFRDFVEKLANSEMPPLSGQIKNRKKEEDVELQILAESKEKAGKWKEPDTNEKEMFKVRDCPFCTTHNSFESDYCAKCGKPMTLAKIKESEKQNLALETMQSLISELKRLEDKGFDIQQLNSFMQDWSKGKEKRGASGGI